MKYFLILIFMVISTVSARAEDAITLRPELECLLDEQVTLAGTKQSLDKRLQELDEVKQIDQQPTSPDQPYVHLVLGGQCKNYLFVYYETRGVYAANERGMNFYTAKGDKVKMLSSYTLQADKFAPVDNFALLKKAIANERMEYHAPSKKQAYLTPKPLRVAKDEPVKFAADSDGDIGYLPPNLSCLFKTDLVISRKYKDVDPGIQKIYGPMAEKDEDFSLGDARRADQLFQKILFSISKLPGPSALRPPGSASVLVWLPTIVLF